MQMTFAPILVGLSLRIGRSRVLRICLAGAAAASLLIALSGSVFGSVWGVLAGRTLAGVFAACVPVAQAGVTDIVPKNQTALGLSRVSAASQLGVVVGPAASALFQEGFALCGLPSAVCLPAVFVVAAAFAVSVLTQMAVLARRSSGSATSIAEAAEEAAVEAKSTGGGDSRGAAAAATGEEQAADVGALRFAQPMLRTITVVIGWTAILSNSIYGLFGEPQEQVPRVGVRV